MFELRIALKYLLPKRKSLSTALVSLMSVAVISLVVWLVLVFLSVTAGIEKTWLSKLTSLYAPLRISPTENYYRSYFYQIDGLAASAASVVAMAGDTIRMAQNGLMMIHEPHTMAQGKADDMRRTADLLDKVREQILDAYSCKSKAGRQRLAEWMSAETWFTGAEAVDAGLADSVTQPVQIAALADTAKLMGRYHYQHAPRIEAPSASSGLPYGRACVFCGTRLTVPAGNGSSACAPSMVKSTRDGSPMLIQ